VRVEVEKDKKDGMGYGSIGSFKGWSKPNEVS
jgi:hypothetical protein